VRTLAHLSDLHFGRTDPALHEPLRRSLHALAPDLVVVSGDLTQRARAKQFREARDYLDALPKPQLVVPGNHDVPLYDVVRRFFNPLGRYRRIVSEDTEPVFQDAELAVVGVNTARSLVFKGGRINDRQVARIRERLCDLDGDVTKIVVSHHPFDVPDGSDQADQIVGRARRALEKLAGCGADLFLSGHLHATHVGHTADRYRIAGLSALVVQAGTALSTRERGEANSYNVLRVSSRRIAIEARTWDGADFAPRSTQSYDHVDGGWNAAA
jgi:3',5'-cyclic AMP phosphodiesterase CpdA